MEKKMYIKEEWNFSENKELLEGFFDLIKSKNSFTVIKQEGKDGIVLVGDDYESEEQANKILAALNA